MADREKYMIKVEGNLVEVTPEVYYAYFRMERQERGQRFKIFHSPTFLDEFRCGRISLGEKVRPYDRLLSPFFTIRITKEVMRIVGCQN